MRLRPGITAVTSRAPHAVPPSGLERPGDLGYVPAMQDKQRDQRRAKRAEKTRKKREGASRPGVGGPASGSAVSAAKAQAWPTGDCYVSEGWDEPGARIDAVFSRSRADGSAAIAVFQLDRSGPGLVSSKAILGARREHVTGECARLSEASGLSMVGCAPAVVATLVRDARAHGAHADAGSRDPLTLLDGVPDVELPAPFGPDAAEAPAESAPAGGGLLGGLRKRLFGG